METVSGISLGEKRTHQQGGYSTNLAPAKLVGKLLNLIDSTAHRVVGGLPPPVPSTSHGRVHSNEHYHQAMVPRVSTSQSMMAMSSLMHPASREPISEWTADGNKMTMPNRSVLEPDFSRTPRQDQVDLSKEAASSNAQVNPMLKSRHQFLGVRLGSVVLTLARSYCRRLWA